MKNLLPHPIKKYAQQPNGSPQTRYPFVKKLGAVLLLLGLIAFPELMLHSLLTLAHTLYESMALMFEKMLDHVLGLDKFHSQLVVFYLSGGLVLWGFYWLWRCLPAWILLIKYHLSGQYCHLCEQTIHYWHCLSVAKKIYLSLIPLTGLIGAFVLLLS